MASAKLLIPDPYNVRLPEVLTAAHTKGSRTMSEMKPRLYTGIVLCHQFTPSCRMHVLRVYRKILAAAFNNHESRPFGKSGDDAQTDASLMPDVPRSCTLERICGMYVRQKFLKPLC